MKKLNRYTVLMTVNVDIELPVVASTKERAKQVAMEMVGDSYEVDYTTPVGGLEPINERGPGDMGRGEMESLEHTLEKCVADLKNEGEVMGGQIQTVWEVK